MTSPQDSDESDSGVASESQFESYFDPESGAWSLRRIPSSPPPVDREPDGD